jgi:hypothetical protein
MTMSKKWTLKYGSAAVFASITIIVLALFAQPITPNQNQTPLASSFLVMLTDPPTVPAGTTLLNLTYSDVGLHIAYINGTTEWRSLSASGTVNLFSLINMSKTIAATTIPTNSSVDKIQFTIVDVQAVVNGSTYNVTALSNTLVMNVAHSQVNQTLSGVLIDFNPTLVQIQATDVNGTIVNYYVLVPSATASIIEDLTEEHVKVGSIVEIGQNNRAKLVRVVEEYSKNVTIVSATLSVNGNKTSLAVTIKNNGNVTFRIFGLTLHGEFNATKAIQKSGHENDEDEDDHDRIHPETIPFRVNDSSLIPIFGANGRHDNEERHDNEDKHDDSQKCDTNENTALFSLTLQPGQSVTLSFSDIIALQSEKDSVTQASTVVTPIVGNNYTLRLMGEGFNTLNIMATS